MPNSRYRPLATLLGALMLLLLAGCGSGSGPLEPIEMPEQWGEYTRIAFLDGKEALHEFDKQHKKRIPLRQGARGWYQHGDSRFEVWVASGRSEQHARQMILDMTNKLAIAPERIFTKPEPLTLEGIPFHRTAGQDRINFYYQKGLNVYWIAFTENIPEPTRLLPRIYQDF